MALNLAVGGGTSESVERHIVSCVHTHTSGWLCRAGKYFCHDVRVVRLPRHGASCPVGIGVSCSADRQALGKITREGVFLEQLETNPGQVSLPFRHINFFRTSIISWPIDHLSPVCNPAQYLPDVPESALSTDSEVVKVNLNQPMAEIRKLLSQYPIRWGEA